MSYINFTNLKGQIIPAKNLYYIDKDHNLQEIKYEKIRDWWNQVLSEDLTITASETINIIDDNTTNKLQTYIEWFKNNHFTFQAKAIYFIDAEGNAIEFVNEIKKNWAEEYVIPDEVNYLFIPDISLSNSENLSITLNDSAEDEMSYILYPDISTNSIEDLVCTVNNPFGTEGLDITLIPIILLNIDISVSENLEFAISNPIDSDSVSITLTPV